MPDLVSLIITRVQERFGDAVSTDVLDYINRVHRDVVNTIPETGRQKKDINLVSGTAGYALDADTVEISQVLYVTDANTATKLVRTSQDKLVEEQPTWEFDAAAAPTQWYAQGDDTSQAQNNLTLYLYPKPNTATSSGFPIVRCYITLFKALTGTDMIPQGLATADVYIEGSSYYTAAALRGPGAAMPYYQIYQALLSQVEDRWLKMQPQRPKNATYSLERKK